MAIARVRSSGRPGRDPPGSPLRVVFFSEGAAEFFETAVDYLLGYELITERDRIQVVVFYVDDDELRTDLVEAARNMGGDELPATRI